MNKDEMHSVLKRFYSLFEGRSTTKPEDVCTPSYDDHMPHPGPTHLEGLRATSNMIREAFPDATCTVQQVLVDGDKVIGVNLFQGTNTGPLMGQPPTNKKVSMSTIDICRIENGKVAEIWHVEDMFGLMIQLGVVPPPGGGH